MVVSFLPLLSDYLQILFLSIWLDVRSLATLDVAVSSGSLRPSWMVLLKHMRSPALDNWGHSLSSLVWLARRGIRASRVQVKVNTSLVRVCDILQLETSDIVVLGLRDCCNITDQCVMNVINCCLKLRSTDLRGCRMMTDAGVSALSAGCNQLQSVDLSDCNEVTDAGVIALGAGCSQLQSVKLSGCDKVTDAGVIALGAGCGQLQSVKLSGCDKVTDAGLIALDAGCGQLKRIGLSFVDK